MPPPPSASPAAPTSAEHTQVKETLVSIIIAFILAFVFRAFVVEAFVIPTGSMAPTLMGAHVRITSPSTGYTWPVGPWFGGQSPLPVQGTPGKPLIVGDPMTGEEIVRTGERRRSGDRILVFKYLYSVYDPRRFDVVVFKAPHEPAASVNYIKRLIGLPGEEVALVDGDVFVRRASDGGTQAPGGTWFLPGWQVQRKDERVQRAVWQPVFSSEYEPLTPPTGYRSPWDGAGWEIAGRRSYRHAGAGGAGGAALEWDTARWPITDFYPYNETSHPQSPSNAERQKLIYAVSDVNLRCGVEPESAPVNASAVLRARGHEFRADIDGTAVTLRMGPLGEPQADGRLAPPAAWAVLGTGTLAAPLAPGRVTNLEFWHVDQALWLLADGELVAHGEYDWSPAERLRQALLLDLAHVIETDGRHNTNMLGLPDHYRQPSGVRWEFSGGPLTLHRVGLDRDVHYQAARPFNSVERPRGAHPLRPMVLGSHHFFVCGDNSPASLDARLWGVRDPWGANDPWVAASIDPTEGVVPRDLMIGRAFFVYFPSMIRGPWSPLPMPDFGRMRFIW